jgi:hypothetical protein
MQITVYVSAKDNLWCTHTLNGFIGKTFILKASALAAAIKYVASMAKASCRQIKVQRKDGSYKTVWNYGKDHFPPGRIPLRKNRFTREPV